MSLLMMTNSNLSPQKYLNFFLGLILFCSTVACDNPSSQDIILVDLNTEKLINYSDIFDDLKIVQLDNEVLVGDCDDLLITDNRIIVLDGRISNSVHFFDSNGNLLKSIAAQDGPEVFTSPSTISLINKNTEVLVTDGMSFNCYVYDLSGNFVRQVQTNGSVKGCFFATS
ncbi:6-bladed beta-propeller [Belliella baltica]|nr:6-bladed beta-propeller [Belliella baltica]